MQRSDGDFGTYGELDCRMMLTTPTTGNMETQADGTYRKGRVALLNKPSGPYTKYHLYSATGDAVGLVLEITAGVYTHLSFGDVNKFGTWTGGQFITGEMISMGSAYSAAAGFSTDWADRIQYIQMAYDFGVSQYNYEYMGYVYHPVNSYGDYRDFAPIAGGNVSGSAPWFNQRARFHGVYSDGTTGNSLLQQLMYRSPNSYNDRAALFPTYLTLYDDVSQRNILAGNVEGVRHLRIDNLDPAETVEVEWDVYPHFQKSGDQFVAPISGPFGLAYQRVA